MSNIITLKGRGVQKEFTYKTSRSGGAGGQHVNKVSTKVEALFSIAASQVFNDDEKARLLEKLANKLVQGETLTVSCDETRSQHTNKERATLKLLGILERGLQKPKERKESKPSKNAVKRRLESKSKASEKKSQRKFNLKDYL